MSALAMILTAAMVVPGDGPEKASGEMDRVLDLRGEWEGDSPAEKGTALPVSLHDGRLTVTADAGRVTFPVVFTDEGGGKLRMTATWAGRQVIYLGIFKWEKDRLRMSLGSERPTGYRACDRHFLLTLHRVKSRK